MIINADSLVPHLKEKVRPTHSDASRHLICPECGVRRKLNALGDGRKKCTVCGKKFRVHKVTDDNKLKQCAEILLCFCLDFSANRTTQITHHRYKLVSLYYDHFRKLIAEKSVPEEKIPLLAKERDPIQILHNKERCKWCNSKTHCGDVPVFGVQFRESGEVYIDPLKDEEAVLHFRAFGAEEDAVGRQEGYAGFISCGKFHRFKKEKDGDMQGEQLWTWIRERVRTHHGIWKKNTGYFLKELEWKYNNRDLHPHLQAMKIIHFMPADFLTSWLSTTDEKTNESE